MTPDTPAASIVLPLRLPYPDLSRLATAWAAGQTFALPLPSAPVLHVTAVRLGAEGQRLRATVSVRSRGLLGLKATFDVSGRPVLDEAAQMLSLDDIALSTHREGLSGRLIALLADARVTAYLARLARVDLRPRLAALRAEAQARLPFSPLDGMQVAGTVTHLRVTGLEVGAGALTLTVAAGGNLHVTVKADGLLPPEGPLPGRLR